MVKVLKVLLSVRMLKNSGWKSVMTHDTESHINLLHFTFLRATTKKQYELKKTLQVWQTLVHATLTFVKLQYAADYCKLEISSCKIYSIQHSRLHNEIVSRGSTFSFHSSYFLTNFLLIQMKWNPHPFLIKLWQKFCEDRQHEAHSPLRIWQLICWFYISCAQGHRGDAILNFD